MQLIGYGIGTAIGRMVGILKELKAGVKAATFEIGRYRPGR